nr:hypothetical protein CFP56_66998 [Quercus suber]
MSKTAAPATRVKEPVAPLEQVFDGRRNDFMRRPDGTVHVRDVMCFFSTCCCGMYYLTIRGWEAILEYSTIVPGEIRLVCCDDNGDLSCCRCSVCPRN